jgi:hypothetical protein
MTQQATQILTPVGRLVQGDCFEGQTKDAEGNPLVIKNGPNAGQPRVDYFMAIAIPKTDATYNKLWATIHGEARAAFPSLFDASGNCINPKFAFKVTDGDSQVPNTKGVKPCDREGFPGHWVLNFSGGYAPKCYIQENGAYKLVTDPSMIKRGYYIRIAGTVKGNGSQQQPGVFLNHSMVELVGYGEEIVTGPNADAVFGGAPAAALPAGASATPLAPAAAPAMPGAAPTPAAPAPAAPAPAPAAPAPGQAPAAPAAPVQPATDLLQPGQAPAAPAAPAPAPAAPAPAPAAEVKYQTPDGGQWTEAQLVAAGYDAAQIAALPKV